MNRSFNGDLSRLTVKDKASRLVETKIRDPRARRAVVKGATGRLKTKQPIDFVRTVRG